MQVAFAIVCNCMLSHCLPPPPPCCQEYEETLDVLQLGSLQKMTARLIDGLDIRHMKVGGGSVGRVGGGETGWTWLDVSVECVNGKCCCRSTLLASWRACVDRPTRGAGAGSAATRQGRACSPVCCIRSILVSPPPPRNTHTHTHLPTHSSPPPSAPQDKFEVNFVTVVPFFRVTGESEQARSSTGRVAPAQPNAAPHIPPVT